MPKMRANNCVSKYANIMFKTFDMAVRKIAQLSALAIDGKR
jgi:hypothetical protein